MLVRRVRTLVGAVVVAVLLIGVGSYAFVRHMRVQQAELKSEEDRRAAEAEANRKMQEAEQQRIAALRAAEEEESKRAEAEARTRYAALVSQGNTDSKAGNYDRAIADYNEAIRLDPKSALAFIGRGDAFTNRGDHD